ncbi:MAG: polyphosphate polymerase domain-containing protein [Gammaproteobacteria bacterium]|nr:polyphosphate polymerase domain-containing protein [Gammaproteobacteria bacterium]
MVSSFNKAWLVNPFQTISLKQLNAKAAMLERLDNKYVIRETVLRQAVTELARHFDILEIGGKRSFIYETCYFDDDKNTSYFDHHQGRRQRFKVRVRKYTDADLCFVEIKLKDKRGITVKKRLNYEVDKYGLLDEKAWEHIHSSYRDLYERDFDYALTPAIEVFYQRVTLVAKDGGERMTIDFNLAFSGTDISHAVDENTFIVETKSANGNGIADKILRGLHQHPTKRCSKYCVGMAILRQVQKHNKFMPALRKLIADQTSLSGAPL